MAALQAPLQTSWSEAHAPQEQEHKWPLDACCGYAKRQCLFSENEMVCTHTLYNMVWDGRFPIKVTELPEALKRKGRKS